MKINTTRTLVFAFVLLGCALIVVKPYFQTSRNSPTVEELDQRYGLIMVTHDPEFPVKCSYGLIEGRAATAEELKSYLALFTPEFSLYPRSLIEKTGLKKVVFCKDLAFAGQRRNAIPDFEHDTLYLEVVRGMERPTYMRKVIHHEYFHVIDFKDDGKLYKDDRWKTLNPAGFQYGTGGKNAQTVKGTANLTDAYPGFLNHYSTTGVEEDKAEVFAFLVVENETVKRRMETDPVLRSKVEMLQNLLSSYCPEIQEGFWMRARNVRR